MTYALAVQDIFAKFSMKALPPGCKTEEIYLPLVKAVLLPDEKLLQRRIPLSLRHQKVKKEKFSFISLALLSISKFY